MNRDVCQTLPNRLEVALRDRFETRALLTFTTSTAAQRLPLAGYYAHLCAWHAVWSEVESLAAEEPPAVWTEDLQFSGLLRSDRAYLAPLCGEPEPQVIAAATALARQIRVAFKAERVSLLGVIYALERLMADATAIDTCAHKAFGLTLSGRAFWRYQVIGAGARLAELLDRLETISATGRAADRIEAAARATLGAYLDIERGIQPGLELGPLAAQRTPPGALLPPRPNQAAGGATPPWGILRGAPNGRRPR